MSNDLSKIKERIAKLLSMAEDSASPEEAAIAAKRARSLMDKHQLERWQIEKKISDPIIKRAATRVYAAIPQHMSFLATAVAKYNDCQAVFEWGQVTYKMQSKINQNDGRPANTQGKMVVFRGYESDVLMAIEMFQRLCDACDHQCKTYLTGLGYRKYPVKVGSAFKQAFTSSVTARLGEFTKERDLLSTDQKAIEMDVDYDEGMSEDEHNAQAAPAPSSSNSLVLVKMKAVEEAFGEVKYKESAYSATIDRESAGAWVEGKRAGKHVEIVRSLKE